MDRAVVEAERLDATDALAPLRDRFAIDDDLIYLDGNSLGRPPKSAGDAVAHVLRSWAADLVMGWDDWIDLGQQTGAELAPLLGADPHDVALGDQTSVNVYKLASAAVAGAGGRTDIVTDAGNFPSDLYVLGSVANAAGGRLIIAPEDASTATLAEHMDDSVALVALSHVAYRSGYMHAGEEVTAMAHAKGAMMLWDLAHSAGAVPVDLDTWNADLAVGCTYKYLNGGPGAPGFLFVRGPLHHSLEQPIAGWFGHRDQFGFAPDFDPDPSIRRFLVGTPSILSMVAARAGIQLTAEAGVDALRHKSESLTGLFIGALAGTEADGLVEITTPRSPDARGSHVTVRHDDAYRISQNLRALRVITDHRSPDLIRFGFAPLYNTHRQAVDAARTLRDVVRSGSHTTFPHRRTGVT